ncbi:hypothetical protein BIFGAL_04303 [Bifidobacterium gallicum DSM 20093 = LMG 11596]|uniref:Uncharacterized protein n=1 Tax=Bifidobacterium gallicum DSM 20093 = LMG 11596 TaxID=561180 RepID=D1NWP8_9BIFI|nr:hypothetical protein BIFGAL_04303 [Bifidobacterium gallicum DSM 20093 = LMG 11596]
MSLLLYERCSCKAYRFWLLVRFLRCQVRRVGVRVFHTLR